MPNHSHHLGKAASNRAFLTTIQDGPHTDWIAVVAFYTAVHLVEALRALEPTQQHSTEHRDRSDYVSKHHRPIFADYHVLRDAAYLARYESNKAFNAQFNSTIVRALLVNVRLANIEVYAASYSSSANPPT